MQPFDKHPGNPEAMRAGAENLLAAGAEGLQSKESTQQAYHPAITSVTGIPAPAIERASDPLAARADASSAALVWASAAVKLWGQKVKEFNEEVDRILVDRFNAMTAADETASSSGLEPTAAAQQATDAKNAINADAERRWHAANMLHIVEGGSEVERMLKSEPTDANMEAARKAGLMPDLRYDAWQRVQNAFLGRVLPPFDGSFLDKLIFGTGTGLTLGAAGADGYRLRKGTFMPHSQLQNMSFAERFKMFAADQYLAPNGGRAAGMGRATNFLDRVTVLGATTAAAGGATQQWQKDQGRSDLTDQERGSRVLTRATINGTASYLGASMGIKAGQWLGAVTKSPVVTAVGVNSGVFTGGALGNAVGNGVSDVVVGFQDAENTVSGWLSGDN